MKTKSLPLILLGLLLLAAAAGLTIHNLNEGKAALENAQEALVPLQELIAERQAEGFLPSQSESDLLYADAVQSYPEMPVEEIDGRRWLGILEIPSLSVSLPVMADWNYDLLLFSPCRFTGSYYEKNLTICAHNFQTHFYPLLSIPMETDVYFTNVEGTVFHYRVSNRETVQPTDVADMVDSQGKWDLTLFTCNLGGQTRCAVRCDQVDD